MNRVWTVIQPQRIRIWTFVNRRELQDPPHNIHRQFSVVRSYLYFGRRGWVQKKIGFPTTHRLYQGTKQFVSKRGTNLKEKAKLSDASFYEISREGHFSF